MKFCWTRSLHCGQKFKNSTELETQKQKITSRLTKLSVLWNPWKLQYCMRTSHAHWYRSANFCLRKKLNLTRIIFVQCTKRKMNHDFDESDHWNFFKSNQNFFSEMKHWPGWQATLHANKQLLESVLVFQIFFFHIRFHSSCTVQLQVLQTDVITAPFNHRLPWQLSVSPQQSWRSFGSWSASWSSIGWEHARTWSWSLRYNDIAVYRTSHENYHGKVASIIPLVSIGKYTIHGICLASLLGYNGKFGICLATMENSDCAAVLRRGASIIFTTMLWSTSQQLDGNGNVWKRFTSWLTAFVSSSGTSGNQNQNGRISESSRFGILTLGWWYVEGTSFFDTCCSYKINTNDHLQRKTTSFCRFLWWCPRLWES